MWDNILSSCGLYYFEAFFKKMWNKCKSMFVIGFKMFYYMDILHQKFLSSSLMIDICFLFWRLLLKYYTGLSFTETFVFLSIEPSEVGLWVPSYFVLQENGPFVVPWTCLKCQCFHDSKYLAPRILSLDPPKLQWQSEFVCNMIGDWFQASVSDSLWNISTLQYMQLNCLGSHL